MNTEAEEALARLLLTAKTGASSYGVSENNQLYLQCAATANQYLERFMPATAAEAWDEGHESGFWNGRLSNSDAEALTGIDHATGNNPYRKAR